MASEKWEKHKKHESFGVVDLDEILVVLISTFIFVFGSFYNSRVLQILALIIVIIWYWIKIRYFEKKIVEKEDEIYNVYWENCRPIAQQIIDGRTEHDRVPLRHDLKQLENKRKFLVDKFVVINLIMLILSQLIK